MGLFWREIGAIFGVNQNTHAKTRSGKDIAEENLLVPMLTECVKSIPLVPKLSLGTSLNDKKCFDTK